MEVNSEIGFSLVSIDFKMVFWSISISAIILVLWMVQNVDGYTQADIDEVSHIYYQGFYDKYNQEVTRLGRIYGRVSNGQKMALLNLCNQRSTFHYYYTEVSKSMFRAARLIPNGADEANLHGVDESDKQWALNVYANFFSKYQAMARNLQNDYSWLNSDHKAALSGVIAIANNDDPNYKTAAKNIFTDVEMLPILPSFAQFSTPNQTAPPPGNWQLDSSAIYRHLLR